MTIMITGGAGFIGLNLSEHLLAQGRHVVCFGLEAPSEAFREHVAHLGGVLSVELGDVRDRTQVLDAMRRHGVRRLVHGAAVTAGPEREAQHPEIVAAVNLGGTIEVLEAACRQSLERVIQLSSGSVYGPAVKREGMLDEVDDMPVPESLYGITKYAGERVAIRYRGMRGLDVCAVRLGVCFGRWEHDTGQRDTLSMPYGLLQLAESRRHAIVLQGAPDDWVYASDVAQGITRLLDAPHLHEPLYHLSAGGRWSLPSWCRRLAHACPGFTFEFTARASEANIGAATPVARPPFAIARLKRDVGYVPGFLEPEAFADYWGSRETWLAL